MRRFKTYSVYYCHGKGFQILRDHAVYTKREEGWLPLAFEHDKKDYSSYLTNARYEPSLHCHRSDQKWMEMLLPDVYHDRWEVPPPYGGLKGELASLLSSCGKFINLSSGDVSKWKVATVRHATRP